MIQVAQVAVCSDIRTKHPTQSEHNLEFSNVKTSSYVKKPLGIKRLMMLPSDFGTAVFGLFCNALTGGV